MKKSKAGKSRPTQVETRTATSRTGPPHTRILLAAVASMFVLLAVYHPALHGPFLLDDLYLPFGSPDADRLKFVDMLRTQRPLLMVSFWLNLQLSGQDTFSYHVVNVLLHVVTGGLVFLILRKLLNRAGESDARCDLLALAGAGLFLLHPVQTESVAYIASRSDVQSTLFSYAALAVFFCRPAKGIDWGRVAAILALYGCAVLTKEHALVLPAIFLLADLLLPAARDSAQEEGAKESAWSGLLSNWRLYASMAVGGVLGALFIARLLRGAATVGLTVGGVSWNHYFFTQCRVFWRYLRLMVLPAGLNVDTDFPISRTLFEHGAILGLAGILALVAAAIVYRRRFPLAAFGLLMAIALLAPTSSFIVIKDVVAERRLYLPMLGILLVALDFLRRWKGLDSRNLAAGASVVLLLCAWLTNARAEAWGSAEALWKDTVAHSPRKQRPHFQLAYAYYRQQRCADAVTEFAIAAGLDKPDHTLLIDWGLALECAGKPDEAVEKLLQAAKMESSAHPYALMGMVYGKHGRNSEAHRFLNFAQLIDKNFPMTYMYRANLYASGGDWAQAVEQYRAALRLAPNNEAAAQSLQMAEQQLRQAR